MWATQQAPSLVSGRGTLLVCARERQNCAQTAEIQQSTCGRRRRQRTARCFATRAPPARIWALLRDAWQVILLHLLPLTSLQAF